MTPYISNRSFADQNSSICSLFKHVSITNILTIEMFKYVYNSSIMLNLKKH